MLFVQRVSSNALIYEEAYSKEIGLLLNRAEPGMEFEIDVTELVKNAIKNGIKEEDLNQLIKINTIEGIVFVKAKPEGGFNFPYFSNVTIETNGPTLQKNDKEITKAIYLIKIK